MNFFRKSLPLEEVLPDTPEPLNDASTAINDLKAKRDDCVKRAQSARMRARLDNAQAQELEEHARKYQYAIEKLGGE